MARELITDSPDFLRNCWYVAGRSVDFVSSLKAVRILAEDIVIFRGENGEPIALEDACPHRKLPLSKGSISGSTVVCGYHGLTFDCKGHCVAAPTQQDAIPKRAVVRSYPVEDRWGFLWIWMGDAAHADTNDIVDIPNFTSPNWATTDLGALSMECNYLYIIDNLLDPSHVAWVHLTSFAGAGTDTLPLDMEDDGDTLVVSRWIMGQSAPPYYLKMLPFGDNCDRKQHYECRVPSTAINMSVYTKAGLGGPEKPVPDSAFLNISYNFITPVDKDNSLYFWFQHRNMHAKDYELSKYMFEGATMAFNEDKEVLERVHKGMKDRKTPFLNLGLDAGAMRFRRKVESRIEAEKAD
jgi:phenylpropionate dioxygenase-like ring-hydroxylating dioxygenase large terminal subunit